MEVKNSIAYQYACWCIEPDNEYVGKYIKLQCKAWIDIVDGKDKEAYIDDKAYTKMYKILGIMQHPDLNCPMTEGLEPYAWLLITATLCTKLRNDDDEDIRYYESALLEIARKNFKTFNCAVIFILLLLMEPDFSRFFSVAPDLKLSSELKGAINKIIKKSPYLVDNFKVLRSQGVICKLNESEYTPLAYSQDGMDGKLANAFLADEAGALDEYPVEAMRSSQITLRNKLGIIISTQYPNDDNVMIDEIDIVKKTLDGILEDKRYFGLLYEPNDELKNGDTWKDDDRVLWQANPVAVSYDYIMDTLKKSRSLAILYPNKRENFLCKHCNIQYKGLGIEAFIDVTKVKKCKREIPDDFWKGKRVFIGVDLSLTTDNTSVAMVTVADGALYAIVWGWIPGDKKAEKTAKEHFNYDRAIRAGNCFESEGETISYLDVENHLLELEEKYGVEIIQIGWDRFNAMSSIQKCESKGYDCVIIRQHSDTLHAPTKLLQESILQGKFAYSDNKLLENNFENARCTKDTNLNLYVNKKKSTGKVDMVVSLINATYLAQQDILYGASTEIYTL